MVVISQGEAKGKSPGPDATLARARGGEITRPLLLRWGRRALVVYWAICLAVLAMGLGHMEIHWPHSVAVATSR